jgi:hypothetical protein
VYTAFLMLMFNLYATDGAGLQFPIVVTVPTQSGDGESRWGTQAGMLSFQGGPAWIAASPAENRGTVACIGIDSDGGKWTAIEIDHLFTQFTRNADGSYGVMSLNQSGFGRTFPDTDVAVQAGPFKWRLV